MHGVERLGHRHADPAQAQEPHEPVQATFHKRPTSPLAAYRGRRRRQALGERAAALAGGDGAGPGGDRGGRRRRPVIVLVVAPGLVFRRPFGHCIGVVTVSGVRSVTVIVPVVSTVLVVMVVRVVASGVVGQGGVRVGQGRQRIQRAPDVARVLHHHRDRVGENGRGDLLDAEHRQRPGPVHRLRDAGRLAQVEPAQPADDLDEVLGGRVGQPGLLAPQDLQLAFGAGIVEEQVQAAALERGGQVAGVIRGEDHARRVPGHERPDLRHRYLILGEHLEQDRLQGLVRAVHLVDQQHHGIGRTDGFEQRARGEEALGEEGTLLLRDPLDRGMQVGGVPSSWPIFSRRSWVYRSCLP